MVSKQNSKYNIAIVSLLFMKRLKQKSRYLLKKDEPIALGDKVDEFKRPPLSSDFKVIFFLNRRVISENKQFHDRVRVFILHWPY